MPMQGTVFVSLEAVERGLADMSLPGETRACWVCALVGERGSVNAIQRGDVGEGQHCDAVLGAFPPSM